MANRDLQMGGGGGHPDPEIRVGELKKIFSSASGLIWV